MVAISEGGAWVVGDVAEAVLRRHPSRGAYDFKRVLGRTPEGDPVVASEAARHGGRLVSHPTAIRNRVTGRAVATGRQRAECAAAPAHCAPDLAFALALPPTLPRSAAARLAAHACVDAGSLLYGEGGPQLLLTPQAASCLVAEHLLRAAERELGFPARKCMAAAPADFDAAQRFATLEALGRAGFHVVRLLHEPTAAAIAYGLHKNPHVHKVLVFDFGGGTLDVSLLFLARGAFTVIGTAGDNELGGEDVDDCLAEVLVPGARRGLGGGAGGCAPLALSSEAERVKIALSGAEGGGARAVGWACGAQRGGLVRREQFEAACAHLFDRAMAPVRQALEGASVAPGEVDEVVLVGGSSRLPMVRARLRDLFGGRELRSSVDPDLAVAIGAAASGD
jgi:molecular chaperone DnaK (HSP70)